MNRHLQINHLFEEFLKKITMGYFQKSLFSVWSQLYKKKNSLDRENNSVSYTWSQLLAAGKLLTKVSLQTTRANNLSDWWPPKINLNFISISSSCLPRHTTSGINPIKLALRRTLANPGKTQPAVNRPNLCNHWLVTTADWWLHLDLERASLWARARAGRTGTTKLK